MSELKPADPALAEFTDYFVRNYPGPDTIIGNPHWHAPRIFRAAEYAMKLRPDTPTVSVKPVVSELEAMNEALFNLSDSIRPYLASDDKLHARYEAMVFAWHVLSNAEQSARSPMPATGLEGRLAGLLEGITPGPWAVELGKHEREGEFFVCHPDTECDATTVCNPHTEADARLIAAAPEAVSGALKLEAKIARIAELWKRMANPRNPEHAGEMYDEMDALLQGDGDEQSLFAKGVGE